MAARQSFISYSPGDFSRRGLISCCSFLSLSPSSCFSPVPSRRSAERARNLQDIRAQMLVHLLGKLDLNAQETHLLGRLTLHLGRGESEHDLLVNDHVFDACAQKMRLSETVSETHMSALRAKIGFRVMQPEGVPTSSEELPEGLSVLLVAGTGTRLRGTLAAQGPEHFSCGLVRECHRPQ